MSLQVDPKVGRLQITKRPICNAKFAETPEMSILLPSPNPPISNARRAYGYVGMNGLYYLTGKSIEDAGTFDEIHLPCGFATRGKYSGWNAVQVGRYDAQRHR